MTQTMWTMLQWLVVRFHGTVGLGSRQPIRAGQSGLNNETMQLLSGRTLELKKNYTNKIIIWHEREHVDLRTSLCFHFLFHRETIPFKKFEHRTTAQYTLKNHIQNYLKNLTCHFGNVSHRRLDVGCSRCNFFWLLEGVHKSSSLSPLAINCY